MLGAKCPHLLWTLEDFGSLSRKTCKGGHAGTSEQLRFGHICFLNVADAINDGKKATQLDSKSTLGYYWSGYAAVVDS